MTYTVSSGTLNHTQLNSTRPAIVQLATRTNRVMQSWWHTAIHIRDDELVVMFVLRGQLNLVAVQAIVTDDQRRSESSALWDMIPTTISAVVLRRWIDQGLRHTDDHWLCGGPTVALPGCDVCSEQRSIADRKDEPSRAWLDKWLPSPTVPGADEKRTRLHRLVIYVHRASTDDSRDLIG